MSNKTLDVASIGLDLNINAITVSIARIMLENKCELDMGQYAIDTASLSHSDITNYASTGTFDIIRRALSNQGIHDGFIQAEVIAIYIEQIAKL